MTDRTDRGAGSLDGDDADLTRDTTSGVAGSTSGAAGQTDMGSTDATMPPGSSGLGLDAGNDLGSESVRTSTSERVTLGSSIDASDRDRGGATRDADLYDRAAEVVPVPVVGTEAMETSSPAPTDAETGSGSGGLSGALPGAAIGALAGAALGAAASALLGGGDTDKTSHIEDTIDVDAPVRVVYNQWTQFEEFPRFMDGVERVQQLDDKRLHWQADIGFKDKAWDAEIVEQVPDQRVAWRSTSGAPNGGVVTFQPIDANRTRVTLRLEYAPEGVVENVGDSLGLVQRRVTGDLERFKQFIEARGTETGGWRGQI